MSEMGRSILNEGERWKGSRIGKNWIGDGEEIGSRRDGNEIEDREGMGSRGDENWTEDQVRTGAIRGGGEDRGWSESDGGRGGVVGCGCSHAARPLVARVPGRCPSAVRRPQERP